MKELLQKIQYNGDQQAFNQLYQQLFFKLSQFAHSFLHSHQIVEEIVNDVFLRLWEKRNVLEDISNLNVYLYVAIKNASLNELRKRKTTIPFPNEDFFTYHVQLKANPETIFITNELCTQVRDAIDQLPPKSKLIFKLVKEEGRSYKEVAETYNISVKTVDAQVCYAMKKLTHSLLPVWKERTKGTSLKETV